MIRWTTRVVAVLVAYCLGAILVTRMVPPPDAVGLGGPPRPIEQLRFLHDDSWLDAQGQRHVEQRVFDTLFGAIDAAERFIYLDLFLFNDWQGPVPETTRALSAELTQRLVQAVQRKPGLQVVLVTDPINTVYGGMVSTHLQTLSAAGVEVVTTDLWPLQDSNIVWSALWRWTLRPFGNEAGEDTLPNPLTRGRVSLRSWLALLNFKANHRKLGIMDDPASGSLTALVMSANPHDGSSAHRNVAFQVSGPVIADLLEAESGVPGLQENPVARSIVQAMRDSLAGSDRPDRTSELPSIALANESAIRSAVLTSLQALGAGDSVDLEMFYLSERRIVTALGEAARRGVVVRALLDVNADAFGRPKNGVPNRPVADELVGQGVSVRWCATKGEQCHAKWFHARHGDIHTVISGSGNLTRRNLGDFNLETDLVLKARTGHPVVTAMTSRFERLWSNEPGRTYSVAYETHADGSLWLKLQYRFMEATGLGTF